LQFAERPDVGVVGAKLYYPDQTIQHAGIAVGFPDLAIHLHKHARRTEAGYMGRLKCTQNVSAVTAACMMVRREVFSEAGGFDDAYAVAFGDVDLCMEIRKKGFLIVWTPEAELYHYEASSRGYELTLKKQQRFQTEADLFRTRWQQQLEQGDPFYSPNFLVRGSGFLLKT
jgi:GT2 family glycosyltransferase